MELKTHPHTRKKEIKCVCERERERERKCYVCASEADLKKKTTNYLTYM